MRKASRTRLVRRVLGVAACATGAVLTLLWHGAFAAEEPRASWDDAARVPVESVPPPELQPAEKAPPTPAEPSHPAATSTDLSLVVEVQTEGGKVPALEVRVVPVREIVEDSFVALADHAPLVANASGGIAHVEFSGLAAQAALAADTTLVIVTASEHAKATAIRRGGAAGARTITVALQPGGALRGRAILADGTPAPGVPIHADGSAVAVVTGLETFTSKGAPRSETLTDDKGHFELAGLDRSATYDLSIPLASGWRLVPSRRRKDQQRTRFTERIDDIEFVVERIGVFAIRLRDAQTDRVLQGFHMDAALILAPRGDTRALDVRPPGMRPMGSAPWSAARGGVLGTLGPDADPTVLSSIVPMPADGSQTATLWIGWPGYERGQVDVQLATPAAHATKPVVQEVRLTPRLAIPRGTVTWKPDAVELGPWAPLLVLHRQVGEPELQFRGSLRGDTWVYEQVPAGPWNARIQVLPLRSKSVPLEVPTDGTVQLQALRIPPENLGGLTVALIEKGTERHLGLPDHLRAKARSDGTPRSVSIPPWLMSLVPQPDGTAAPTPFFLEPGPYSVHAMKRGYQVPSTPVEIVGGEVRHVIIQVER